MTATQLNLLPIQIADSTLGASAASFDFTSLPSQFAHLLIEVYSRGDAAVTNQALLLRFNNDSGANYDRQYGRAFATTLDAGESFAQTSWELATMPGASAGANLFGLATVYVPHYTNAANNKLGSSTYAMKYGTATTDMETGTFAGFWRSNSAITRVTILPVSGNFVSGSRVTIYGLA